jgi:hypothetical protein
MKGHRVWYSAKGPRVTGLRLNIYLILWIFIIIGSVYLLVRFAAISFSHEMGQAGSYQDAVYYYISNQVIESGSSLVSYHTRGEEAAVFPLNMLSRHFPLASFIKDQGFLISDAEKKIKETYAKEKVERYLLPEGAISEAYLLSMESIIMIVRLGMQVIHHWEAAKTGCPSIRWRGSLIFRNPRKNPGPSRKPLKPPIRET